MDGDRICNVSVGEGTVIPVNKEMVSNLMQLWKVLEDENIEIDVEDVAGRKINLYLWQLNKVCKKKGCLIAFNPNILFTFADDKPTHLSKMSQMAQCEIGGGISGIP